jgi:hypothetical protein
MNQTLVAGALLLGACSNGPTGPDGEPLVFQGTVVYQGSTSHSLAVTDYGGVRFELENVTPRLIDVTNGLTGTNVGIGFALGQPDSESCVTTYQVTLYEGDVLSFSLGDGNYCVLMFDSGLPVDAVVDYTLVVTR